MQVYKSKLYTDIQDICKLYADIYVFDQWKLLLHVFDQWKSLLFKTKEYTKRRTLIIIVSI